MSKAPEEMVNIIRDIVQQEIAKMGQTILCRVAEKKDDTHYDLYVESDDSAQSTPITNVINTTRFDLKRGDYVYVHTINNQLNNAFIIGKVGPFN